MSKTILITGSTRGIGRALALELAAYGSRVIVNGLRQREVDRVVEEITEQNGEAWGVQADVSNPDEVTLLVEATVKKYGTIDMLIHNAGNLRDRKIRNMTDEDWHDVLNVHLTGAFYCIRRALPYLSARGGDILLLTSTAGLKGSVGQANYSAAKAGMLGLVWTLAEELRREHIRIHAIAPAALTDMTRPVIERLTERARRQGQPFPAEWQVGDTESIAQFVRHLLSQRDPDLTGQIFGVNGSRITLWQKPYASWHTDGVESFFAEWTRRERGGKA
ncbi:3-oxoacyl-ACP reductase [Saccharibacillus sp. O16]|nr:3-oxoacyl-ACP reductase [Saccharibacillus sp. O16]